MVKVKIVIVLYGYVINLIQYKIVHYNKDNNNYN